MQQPQVRHWIMLLSLSVFWGFSFYLIAIGLESFPPLTLVNIRLAIGALALYCLMRWQGRTLPSSPAWWMHFSVLSLLGNLVPFTLISWAETSISSAQAGLLMALMPISTAVLAHLFVPEERLTPRRIAGVLLGFAGVLILIGGDVLMSLGGGQMLAQMAVLAATFAYASNAVYTRRIPRIDTLVVATGTLIIGTVVMMPLSFYLDRPWQLSPETGPVLATLTLGLVSSGLATWVYFRVVADCGPAFLSIINYIIPAIAFAAGVALLGEPAATSQFVGLIAVLTGIALTQQRRKLAQPSRRGRALSVRPFRR